MLILILFLLTIGFMLGYVWAAEEGIQLRNEMHEACTTQHQRAMYMMLAECQNKIDMAQKTSWCET